MSDNPKSPVYTIEDYDALLELIDDPNMLREHAKFYFSMCEKMRRTADGSGRLIAKLVALTLALLLLLLGAAVAVLVLVAAVHAAS